MEEVRIKSKSRGSSTLEYIVLITGIVSILVVFLSPGGVFQTAISRGFNSTTNSMLDMSSRLENSHNTIEVVGSMGL